MLSGELKEVSNCNKNNNRGNKCRALGSHAVEGQGRRGPGEDYVWTRLINFDFTVLVGKELPAYPEPQEALASLEGALRCHYRPPPPGLAPASLGLKLEAFQQLVAAVAAVICSFLREMLDEVAAAGGR